MTRHRSVVLASLPPCCTVCDSLRRVRLVALPGLPVRGGGYATCPHCAPERGHSPLPIYSYVLREDQPRGDAA